VTVGNQVLPLNDKEGVFLFLCFFLEALKEKKLDYSIGNFNLNPFQPHFLNIYSNHRKKFIISYIMAYKVFKI